MVVRRFAAAPFLMAATALMSGFGPAVTARADDRPMVSAPVAAAIDGAAIRIEAGPTGRVVVGRLRTRATATGAGLERLTVHLRGPIDLAGDEDRRIHEVKGPADHLVVDGTVDTASLPPGRYVHYVDAHDTAGRRLRSTDRVLRIGPSAAKPRLLFDSDYFHILDVESPYNRDAAKTRFLASSLTREKIRAAFSEIVGSGVDTLVLSPGVGEIGYYPNAYYSSARHRAWWQAVTGRKPPSEPFLDYAIGGGDPIEDARAVVDAAKKKLFVSIRMNDGHAFYLDNALDKRTGAILAPGSASFYRLYSQFAASHPELRIGPDPTLPSPRYASLLDYAKGTPGEDPVTKLKTSVREHKRAIIAAMLAGHRVDGVVLDFLRLAFLFNQHETTFDQRLAIMVELISSLRRELDGPHRDRFGSSPQLLVRIPFLSEEWSKLGVSIPEWALAGVDGFVFSFERNWAQPFYYQGAEGTKLSRLDGWKAAAGNGVSFLQEINFATESRLVPDPRGAVDPKTGKPKYYSVQRRTREQMMISGAASARSVGADGIYLFNMPYYRGRDSYADPEVSVTPPFAWFACLRDPACFGRTDAPYYFLAPKAGLDHAPLPKNALQLPRKIDAGRATFLLHAPEPDNGWPKALRLRIEIEEPNAAIAAVRVNGVPARPVDIPGEPYDSPFRYAVAVPDRTTSYAVDRDAMKADRVEITVEAAPGPRPTVRWIDLTALRP